MRRDLLGFVNPDFSCCELERGRHQSTYAFFSLNFTLGRSGAHLLSQMVPNPQLLRALPTFPLPGGCLGTSVPTSWAPGLPSSLCDGAPLIRAHSQLPTHASQVSWKECGGSWAGDHKTETPRTRRQVRKRLPERRSPGREVARKGNQHKMTQPAVLWDAACTARENKFLQQVYLPGEEGESETCSGGEWGGGWAPPPPRALCQGRLGQPG